MSASRKLQLRCIWWGLVYVMVILGAMICASAFVFWDWTFPHEWDAMSRFLALLVLIAGFAWGATEAALRRSA